MNRTLVVYIDNCCNSRLFDGDPSPKVNAQADKIRLIINNRKKDGYIVIGSFVGEAEISKIPDDEKRRAAEQSYKESIDDNIQYSPQIIVRARKLESMGLKPMDARHLAAAEAAGADFLLTTDEKFIKRCAKNNLTAVKVIDPLDF
ncbi:MAG: PIN domain-containing protein [Chitinispirillales bacterium]|jgi:predicted nucleic acid-binding protein|nr:PIN domain-containing protein [Chitinispirillales bacterium]